MVYPKEFEAKMEEKLQEARREAWEREARLANLEKKIEVLSRALEHLQNRPHALESPRGNRGGGKPPPAIKPKLSAPHPLPLSRL